MCSFDSICNQLSTVMQNEVQLSGSYSILSITLKNIIHVTLKNMWMAPVDNSNFYMMLLFLSSR